MTERDIERFSREDAVWRSRGEAEIREEMERRLAQHQWRRWGRQRAAQAAPVRTCLCGHDKTAHQGRPMRCVMCGCVEYHAKVAA